MIVGTIIGIDFGTRQWGLAVGNTATKLATSIQSIRARNGEPNWINLKLLQEKWHASAIVIGLPLNMDGTDQPLTQRVRAMAKKIEKELSLPVYFQDERLSTVEAKAELFASGGYKSLKKDKIDSLSAVIILQDWLSS